jgi:hypothetical protein
MREGRLMNLNWEWWLDSYQANLDMGYGPVLSALLIPVLFIEEALLLPLILFDFFWLF